MRYGKDDLETHEPMQIRRHERKYMPGQRKRHLGLNRLKRNGAGRRPTQQ